MSKTKNILPPFLNKGDTIAIVSTARKISPEEINPAIKALSLQGYNVIIGDHIYDDNKQFAGTDNERTSDFQRMLDDKSVKAIICARGGYGSIRIIPHLDFNKFIKSPKWIIGYSDITAFHSHLNRNHNTCTIHGTMPINFTSQSGDIKSVKELMEVISGKLSDIVFPYHHLNRSGSICGEVVGGNLSMLYSMRGTPQDIETEGKILFIEDLDEYLYHIDRMIMNLKLGNKLAKLKGMIIGGMSEMNDNTIPFGKTAEEIIIEHISEYDFPVAFSFPAGHIKPNLPIILGNNICLEINDVNSVVSY